MNLKDTVELVGTEALSISLGVYHHFKQGEYAAVNIGSARIKPQ